MMRIVLCAAALLAAWILTPQGHARPSSSDSIPVALKRMLLDYRTYAETLWRTAEGRPDLGYWGTGRADWNNEGTRAVSNTALVYAVLYVEGDRRYSVRERIEPALRYQAAIYKDGPLQATDGKQWGEGWQTAMWAANLGVAAWIVREELDPRVLADIQRIVAVEADRFITLPPPTMAPGDTKAEENAWNLMAPAAALLLLPDHPHASDWHQAVLRWGFNTLSVEADRSSDAVRDGHPLRHWISTTQMHPDGTLENHGIFHPVYAMVAPATLGQAAVLYRMAGRPVPEALKHNVLQGWETLQSIVLPDGEWLYPQGLDWELHDYEHVHYFAMLATLYQDPAAALLEKRLVDASRRRQSLNGDGRFVGVSSRLGFAREAVQAERTAYSLLMHKRLNPPPPSGNGMWNRFVHELPPVRIFDQAGFLVHRTPRGAFSLSWKNHLMGVVAPDSGKYLKQPYVTTPHTEGLVGGFTLEGRKPEDRFTLERIHTLSSNPDSVALSVQVLRYEGALRQEIAMASLASGIIAYIDRVTAAQDVVVREERGLPLGIENHELTGDRTLFLAEGAKQTMPGGRAADTPLPGPWVNVDRRLSLISLSEPSHLFYRSVQPYNRSGAREDYLFGAYHSGSRAFRKGNVVAQRCAIILMNSTPQETKRITEKASFQRLDGVNLLKFQDTNGKKYSLELLDGAGARWNGVDVCISGMVK